jgi:hypothetical protein
MHSINPQLWGPPAWDFLFYVVLSYSDTPTQDEKNNIKTFFESLGNILPCEKCQYNYKKHTTITQLSNSVLASRYTLVLWLLDIYNDICVLNNKKILTYQNIIDKYVLKKQELLFNINPKTVNNIIILMLISLLIIYIKCKKN